MVVSISPRFLGSFVVFTLVESGFAVSEMKEISSLHADCLTKWVRQFRLGIAINRSFECSVFRGSVFRRGRKIRRDSAGRFSREFDNSGRAVPTNGEPCCGRLCF